ncbi:hypothetical protein NDN08_006731 [Rhodosorus marinus]|uniref:Uncharacterized protein n=1 Tax=Rhodosorus marinus TaxID=101924 RepID=A0AAV8UIJ4_9RHOD|nr:hypothetical protein NDN08_006731 [Rhodosorus marinus]
MAFVGSGFVGGPVGGHRGCCVCSRRKIGRLAVRMEADVENEKAVENPLAPAVDNTKMFEAASKQDVSAIDDALDEGADATATDPNGRSILHYVAAIGAVPTITTLLEKGAEIDAQDVTGLTPLHMAAGYARQGTVEYLLDQGADPSIQNGQSQTAFDLVELLLSKEPEKKFFMKNKKHENLSNIRLMLRSVTKLVQDQSTQEDSKDNPVAAPTNEGSA